MEKVKEILAIILLVGVLLVLLALAAAAVVSFYRRLRYREPFLIAFCDRAKCYMFDLLFVALNPFNWF